VVALVGCGASDKDIFEKAEQHYARKQSQEALRYYRLLSDDHPDSEWADRALERQAEVLANHLDKPAEGVRAYQRLVSQFPNSKLAPAAQLRIGELSYRKLHRYEEAVAAYNRALADYGGDPALSAEVRLALGKIDYEEGKWEGAEHFTAVLRDYAADLPHCAEAQFYLARAQENVRRDASRAIEEYQKVIDKYPNTKWAEEAKKAVGWIYYYTDRTKAAEEKAEPRQVLVDIRRAPGGAREHFTPPPFVRSVEDCLRSLGVQASASHLMGISGLAFQFYYDRNDRLGGADYLPQNPLEAICRALGLKATQQQATNFQEGFESLRKALEEKQPTFVPLVLPPPSWVTVAGYDEAAKTVALVDAQGVTRSISWEQLAKSWSTASCPSLDPMSGRGARYSWYAFRKSGTPQSPAQTAERAILAGTRIMQDTRSGSFAAGFRAYGELTDDLRTPRDYSGVDKGDRDQLVRWAVSALPRLIAARKAAAAFLRTAGSELPNQERGPALAAAANFDQAVEKLRLVSLGAPRATSVSARAESSSGEAFKQECDASASALEEVVRAERGAYREMERICK